MASLSALQAYPLSPTDALRTSLVNQHLGDIPTPAAIIDVAKARKNCSLMLDAVEKLGVKFRAHVKTHKTTELTRLQVGANCKDVRLVVSTVLEAERLIPLLQDFRSHGATVNVLYGVPLAASQVSRLAAVGHALGPESISTMIDHPSQLAALEAYAALAGSPAGIFIKADAGTSRAGVSPASPQMQELVRTASALEAAGKITLHGFYSHAGHSYSGSSPEDAMSMLIHEIETAVAAAKVCIAADSARTAATPLVISVGASPTILSVQNLFPSSSSPSKDGGSEEPSPAATQLAALLTSTKQHFTLELHAGVYPLLDMQQEATHARSSSSLSSTAATEDIALTILAEVSSLYPSRKLGKPEALISAGSLALGREPCKSYKGWGVVTPWGFSSSSTSPAGEAARQRIVVARISQEHGILAYDEGQGQQQGQAQEELPLTYGQKLRIWPNHACIAGAMYAFYVVVDSESEEPDRVVDVWTRWRGW